MASLRDGDQNDDDDAGGDGDHNDDDVAGGEGE